MFGAVLERLAGELQRRSIPYMVIGATPVRFASAEDLVILKVVAGRPRDLEDARLIIERQGSLDRAHIEKWLLALGRALESDFLRLFRSLLPPRK